MTIVESTTNEDILYDVYDILESVMGDELEGYFTESFFASPVRKFLKELESIKNTKPADYDGPDDVKGFVEKNYDKIKKIANHLEEDPEKLRKDDIGEMASLVLGICGSYAIIFTCPVAGLVGMIVSYIAAIVMIIVRYIRVNDDKKAFNQLVKIRSSLKKVINKKGLNETVKRKISDMITAIDDAEDELSTRVKTTVKESVLQAYKENILTESEVIELLTEGFEGLSNPERDIERLKRLNNEKKKEKYNPQNDRLYQKMMDYLDRSDSENNK